MPPNNLFFILMCSIPLRTNYTEYKEEESSVEGNTYTVLKLKFKIKIGLHVSTLY
jgi:hypothetical protein